VCTHDLGAGAAITVAVVANECEAFQHSPGLACAAPPGTFACAQTFCRTGVEYCARLEGGLNIGACAPLPAACTAGAATPSCDCVPLDQACGPSAGQTCTECRKTDGGDIVLVGTVA
jgi:hypothetical protein